MQKLTSITEQLKRTDVKQVINVLSALTKATTDPSKQNIVMLLRRWKQKDVDITETSNEAKDNVKYLYTLERFIDPLYTGNAETITDTLPGTPSIQYICLLIYASTDLLISSPSAIRLLLPLSP
jgi:dynein heavy chain